MQNISTTRAVFEQTASTYDADRARLIPCYERLYRCAVDLIPSDADHILDLGAGTGLLSAFVRERFPRAHLRLIDNAESMLAKSQERFRGDRLVTFEVADYSVAIEPRGYDAIVSALSIHHLEDAAKRKLFGNIFAALRPGGVFVNAEQVAGPTPELEARYKAQWLEQVRKAGAKPQQIADSLLRQQEDRCSSVQEQLAWLQAAGFADADCWFKDGRFAVLAATKKN